MSAPSPSDRRARGRDADASDTGARDEDIHCIILGDTAGHIDHNPLTLFGVGGKAAMLVQNEDEVRVGPVSSSFGFTPTVDEIDLKSFRSRCIYQLQAPTTRSDPADRAPPLWPKVDHRGGRLPPWLPEPRR